MHVYPLLKLMLCWLIFMFVIFVYLMQASGKVSTMDSSEVYACHDFITDFLLFYLQEVCL